jgi:hypothetical protein
MKRVMLVAFAVALACLLVLAACSVMDYKNDDLCKAGCQQRGYGSRGACKTIDEGASKTTIGSCTTQDGPCAQEGACKCYCG